jgi:hypothetical protein
MRWRQRAAVRLGCIALLLTSCAAPRPAAPREGLVQDESGVLIPTERLAAGSFVVAQRVSGKQGTEDVAFDCIVRLADSKLTLSGTTLHSTRAFFVAQEGAHVHAESSLQRDVPFEPINVLYDIHRLFFRGLSSPARDGTYQQAVGEELVREQWVDGQLTERTFYSLDTYAKLISIEFEGAPAPVIAPRVRLTNLHYGYSLNIENLRQQRLDDGYSLDIEESGAASSR